MSKPGKPARRRVWILWAVLLIAGAAAFVWWESRRWEPDRNRFPVQGAWLDAHDGAADWSMLKAH